VSKVSGSHKRLRAKVLEILSSSKTFDEAMALLDKIPAKKAINPLISQFYHSDDKVRWWAISAFGRAVARIAEKDIESARIIMRRLMWSLNDESGGIGWGAPEAMAEAMVQNATLAEEYVRILLSYVWEDGNFLEHDPLRKGALWGIMRLSDVRAMLLKKYDAADFIRPYLLDQDVESKAISILAIKNVGDATDCSTLSNLSKETNQNAQRLKIYKGDGEFMEDTFSSLLEDIQKVLCV